MWCSGSCFLTVLSVVHASEYGKLVRMAGRGSVRRIPDGEAIGATVHVAPFRVVDGHAKVADDSNLQCLGRGAVIFLGVVSVWQHLAPMRGAWAIPLFIKP